MTRFGPTIPVWKTAVAGYRQGIGALLGGGILLRYLLYACVIGFAAVAARLYLLFIHPWHAWNLPAPMVEIVISVLTAVIFATWIFCLSPFGVAIHRNILLGELPRQSYLMALTGRRERRFFLVSVGLCVIGVVALFAQPAAMYLLYGVNSLNVIEVSRASSIHPTMGLITGLIALLALALAAVVAARCVLVFPSIAVDRPGASLRQSFADTRGTTFRLFAVLVLISVPPVIIYALSSSFVFAAFVPAPGSPGGSIRAILLSPPFVAVYALMVTLAMLMIVATGGAAAHAYEIRINRSLSRVAEVFT